MIGTIDNVVALVLRPTDKVGIAGLINLGGKLIDKTIHLGINLVVKALPMVAHTLLEMWELGNLGYPPRLAIAGHVLIDEIIEKIVLGIAVE